MTHIFIYRRQREHKNSLPFAHGTTRHVKSGNKTKLQKVAKNILEKQYYAPGGRVSKERQEVPQNRVKPPAAEVPLHQKPTTEPEGSIVRQRHGVPTAAR